MAPSPSKPPHESPPDSSSSPAPHIQPRSWLPAFVRRWRKPGHGDVIAAEVGADARRVAVGKNTVQIGVALVDGQEPTLSRFRLTERP